MSSSSDDAFNSRASHKTYVTKGGILMYPPPTRPPPPHPHLVPAALPAPPRMQSNIPEDVRIAKMVRDMIAHVFAGSEWAGELLVMAARPQVSPALAEDINCGFTRQWI